MTSLGRAARPTDAASLLRRAVADSGAGCLGGELIGKVRASVGLLGALLGRDGAVPTHGFGEEWQRDHVALVHTGSSTLLLCPIELDGLLLPALDALPAPLGAAQSTEDRGQSGAGASRHGSLRLWVDVHFFSWMYLQNGLKRRPGARDPDTVATSAPERVTDPRELLGSGPLPTKVGRPADTPGPLRIPMQIDAFRIRPGRGVIDVPARRDAPEALRLVSVIGMVPSGGRVSMPGWGSAAVVEATPVHLSDWPGAASGDVRAASPSTVLVGATHVRREDRWRNGLLDHVERLPLPSPFEPTVDVVQYRRHHASDGRPGDERLERVTTGAPRPLAEWRLVSSWQGY